MELSTIINLVDNAENEAELQDALALVVQDLTAQVMATWNAVNDNPYVNRITLEELTKGVAHAVQAEYLDPGSVLN